MSPFHNFGVKRFFCFQFFVAGDDAGCVVLYFGRCGSILVRLRWYGQNFDNAKQKMPCVISLVLQYAYKFNAHNNYHIVHEFTKLEKSVQKRVFRMTALKSGGGAV